jgi:hypothetical protein
MQSVANRREQKTPDNVPVQGRVQGISPEGDMEVDPPPMVRSVPQRRQEGRHAVT